MSRWMLIWETCQVCTATCACDATCEYRFSGQAVATRLLDHGTVSKCFAPGSMVLPAVHINAESVCYVAAAVCSAGWLNI